MTQAEATARVTKGAAHLDRVRPNWFRQIDVGTLTLHDACGCIVGQLCQTDNSNFPIGRSRLGIDRVQAIDFGIDYRGSDTPRLPGESTDLWRCRIFQPLQDAWVVAIADRLLAASTANITEAPALVTA